MNRRTVIEEIFTAIPEILEKQGLERKQFDNNPTTPDKLHMLGVLQGAAQRVWLTHEEALSILKKRGPKLAKFKAAAEKAHLMERLRNEFQAEFFNNTPES